jgi:large-conductance mechanosensitive channel
MSNTINDDDIHNRKASASDTMYGPLYDDTDISKHKKVKKHGSKSIPILNNEILSLGDKRIGNYGTLYDFLANFNVIGSIIGVAIGFAFQNIIKSLTRDIVMPIFEPIFGHVLSESGLRIGYVNLYFGKFISEFLYFLITIFVVYLIIMKIFGSQVNIVIHKMKTPERDYRIQSTVMLNKMDQMDKHVYDLPENVNKDNNNYEEHSQNQQSLLLNQNSSNQNSSNYDYPLTNIMAGDNNTKYASSDSLISSMMPNDQKHY